MSMSRLFLVVTAAGLALVVSPVYAHGFGTRYDLPVPLWLYISGAGAAVALSFVIVGLFVQGASVVHAYPRLNLLRWGFGRALVHPVVVTTIRIFSVGLLVLVIVAGIAGTEIDTLNFAPTMVWVIWWVGTAYASALIGNVWGLVNPWNTPFKWAESFFSKINPDGDFGLDQEYPSNWGVWPGVILFFTFAWVEIVYGQSSVPGRIALMALAYTAITWSGMFIYGRETWLRHGEAFSLAFGFLARFSPTEIRVTDTTVCEHCLVDCMDLDGNCIDCAECFSAAEPEYREFNISPFAVGLLRNDRTPTSMMVFVVLLLSTVTFDGFTATPLWADIFNFLIDAIPNISVVGTIGLLAFPIIFIVVYLIFAKMMSSAGGGKVSYDVIGRAFVFSLIPIALAYHLAHFFAFLLIQGQLIIPLISDPLGRGWDVFGTAGYTVDIAIVNARTAWFVSVAAIVIGHIVAVYLAHVIALRTIAERHLAIRSQYPMMVLMVGYTMVSLWILAQPIVEAGG
jgi:hypothetical protein